MSRNAIKKYSSSITDIPTPHWHGRTHDVTSSIPRFVKENPTWTEQTQYFVGILRRLPSIEATEEQIFEELIPINTRSNRFDINKVCLNFDKIENLENLNRGALESLARVDSFNDININEVRERVVNNEIKYVFAVNIKDIGNHNPYPFTVIEQGIGYNREYSKVALLGINTDLSDDELYKLTVGYFPTKYLKKVSDNIPEDAAFYTASPDAEAGPTRTPSTEEATSVTSDWTSKPIRESYQDSQSDSFRVVIEIDEDGFQNNRDVEVKRLILEGTKEIFKSGGVDNTPEEIQDIIDNTFLFSRMANYSISTREGAPSKALIELQSAYALEYFSTITESPDDDGLENSTFVMFSLSALNEIVQVASDKILFYQQQIDNFDGRVIGFNPEKESNKLRRFPDTIKSAIALTDEEYDESNTIEFDLTLDREVVRIRYSGNQDQYLSSTSLQPFRNRELFSIRIWNYIINLTQIYQINHEEMDFERFVENFIFDDNVMIETGVSTGDNSQIIRGGHTRNEVPIMTRAFRNANNAIVTSREYRQQAHLSILEADAEISDSVNELSDILSSINNIDDSYAFLLNRVDINDIIKGSLACFAKQIGADAIAKKAFEDFDSIKGRENYLEQSVKDFEDSIRIPLTEESELFEDAANMVAELSNGPPQLNSSYDGVASSLPSVPTLSFPDNSPTVDLLSDFTRSMRESILSSLTSVFVQSIKSILSNAITACNNSSEDLSQVGAVNINNSIRNLDSLIAKLNEMGFSDISMFDFFDDLSAALTPREICSVFSGGANNTTIDISLSIVKRRYENFYNLLGTNDRRRREKLSEILSFIGQILGANFCNAIIQATSDKEYCQDDESSFYELRRNLLRSRRVVSDEEIERQIEREKKTKKKIIQDLRNALDGGLIDGKGSITGSEIIPESDHTFNYLVDKVFETIYTGVVSSHDQDLKDFSSSLVEERPANKEVQIFTESDRNICQTVYNIATSVGDNALIKTQEKECFPELKNELKKLEDPTSPDGNLVHLQTEGYATRVRVTLDNRNKLSKKDNPYVSYDSSGAPIFSDDPEIREIQARNFMLLSEEGIAGADTFDKDREALIKNRELYEQIFSTQDASVSKFYDVKYVLSSEPDSGNQIKLYDTVLTTDEAEIFRHTHALPSSSPINQEIKELLDGYRNLPEEQKISKQQYVFSKIVLNSVKGLVPWDSPYTDIEQRNILSLFSLGGYAKISNSFIDSLAHKILSSPLFRTLTRGDTTSGTRLLFKPKDYLIEYINLSLKETRCGEKIDLLNLAEEKEKIISSGLSIRSSVFNKNSENPLTDHLNATDKAIVDSLIRVIVRAHALDYYLRNIFFFSVFSPDSVIEDRSFINVMTSIITADLSSQGAEYYRNLISYVISKNLDKTISEGNRVPEKEVFDSYIADLLKSEMKHISSEVSKIVSFKNSKSISDYLLSEVIKTYDAVRTSDSPLNRYTEENMFFTYYEDSSNKFPLFFENYVKVVKFTSSDEEYENVPNKVKSLEASILRYNETIISIANFRSLLADLEESVVIIGDLPAGLGNYVISKDLEKLDKCSPEERAEMETKIPLFKSVSFGKRLCFQPKAPETRVFSSEISNITFNKIKSLTNPLLSEIEILDESTMVYNTSVFKGDPSGYNYLANKTGVINHLRGDYDGGSGREHLSIPLASENILTGENITLEQFLINSESIIEDSLGSVNSSIQNNHTLKVLMEFCFPVSKYQSLFSMFNIMKTSSLKSVKINFAPTKDQLRSKFISMFNKKRLGYQVVDQSLENVGGQDGLRDLVKDMSGTNAFPVADAVFNNPGLGLAAVAKAIIETPLIMLKHEAERMDPNISQAKRLQDLLSSAGQEVPMWALSLSLLPVNIFPFPIGYGPPIGPLGFAYHAAGLGNFKKQSSDNPLEQSDTQEQLNSAGIIIGGDPSEPCEEPTEE